MAVERAPAEPGRAIPRPLRGPRSTAPTREAGEPWLAFAGREAGEWLADLLLEPGVEVETSRPAFAAALRDRRSRRVILVSPPAGLEDLHLVARQRELESGLGLVLFSNHEAIAVRIDALQLGFDDAIDLSADPAEIRVRLSKVDRDCAADGGANLIRVGPEAQLDLCARILWRAGAAHHLRPRDFELLRFLIERPGQALTRRQLLEAWPGSHVSPRMIDVTIWRLRALIELDITEPRLFVTVPRLGYRYDPPAIRR